jgi:dynein heavy chain
VKSEIGLVNNYLMMNVQCKSSNRLFDCSSFLFSSENAVLVKHCTKWPLLIDPQRQATQWIRTKEADNNLRVISSDDSTLLRVCEQCIRLGLPLIIENVGETIESSLLPLLNRDIFNRTTSSSVGTIRFNDIDIEYNPNFRVYFITQLNNPHFLPDICIRVTLSKRLMI